MSVFRVKFQFGCCVLTVVQAQAASFGFKEASPTPLWLHSRASWGQGFPASIQVVQARRNLPRASCCPSRSASFLFLPSSLPRLASHAHGCSTLLSTSKGRSSIFSEQDFSLDQSGRQWYLYILWRFSGSSNSPMARAFPHSCIGLFGKVHPMQIHQQHHEDHERESLAEIAGASRSFGLLSEVYPRLPAQITRSIAARRPPVFRESLHMYVRAQT